MTLCGDCWEAAENAPEEPPKAADVSARSTGDPGESVRPASVSRERRADPDVCDICGRSL